MSAASLPSLHSRGLGRAEGIVERIHHLSPAARVYWLLRIGVALEFVGHGMAGLARSTAWLPYFDLFGISKSSATDHWFFVTATVDTTVALLVLVRPMRSVLLHMTFWGLFTAVLRPITGESLFELIERGANYGMPLAFLLLAGWGSYSWRDLFTKIEAPDTLDARQVDLLAWVVRIIVAVLLVGHGGLGIWAHKAEWTDFFGFFGVGGATVSAAHLPQVVGCFEVALGLAVFVKPVRGLLIFVLSWKVGTELLRPLVGQPMFQFIERSGDYALPLALLVLVGLEHAEMQPSTVGTAPAFPSHPIRSSQSNGRTFPQRWHVSDGARFSSMTHLRGTA